MAKGIEADELAEMGRRVAIRRVRPADRDDAAQEFALAALLAARDAPPADNLRGYQYHAGYRAALRVAARRTGERRRERELDGHGPIDPAGPAAGEYRVLVRELLARLPARARQVLILRYGLDGGSAHTLAEIGDLLGISAQRVLQIQRKALRTLQRPQNPSDYHYR